MPKVQPKIKHFLWTISPAVEPATWFMLSRGLEDVLWEVGYELDVFYDCCDADRQWILEQDSLDFFEGIVESTGTLNENEISDFVSDYLASHEIQIEAFELDDDIEDDDR